MNILKIEKQEAAIAALVEGSSIRSVERMTGIHRDTIMRLMVRTGEKCAEIHDQRMHHLKCKRVQVDEAWCYVGKKQRHLTEVDNPLEVGDQWVWTALDADSKIIPSYKVGKRTAEIGEAFIRDLSLRLDNKVQLSSDALNSYIEAVEKAFGKDVDYGQIVKSYEAEPMGAGRYSPPHVVSAEREKIMGNPDIKHISTSFVERANLTLRMQSRRFTRLTNGFSKKLHNLKAAVALYVTHYNFVRIHGTLRMTPAMAAGVTDHLWTIRDLLKAN
jgi:IS1 family transposase